ncbi:MAG: hypothetical protein IKP64_12690 [Selenomonadaceae bacterium]|nr:hypothetical protein [Selenomonadaceae bacterium]MBR4384399.1 hypothetical protein [Selenomonadaceae bacterium]
MNDVFHRYKHEISIKHPEKEDSAPKDDKISADEDFGSIYVSDETFLKLMSDMKKRHEQLTQKFL